MITDILKNNLLKGRALFLVIQVQEIDEVWARLKAAYGNLKLLLKKTSEISRISQLWKLKDPEKLVGGTRLDNHYYERFTETRSYTVLMVLKEYINCLVIIE